MPVISHKYSMSTWQRMPLLTRGHPARCTRSGIAPSVRYSTAALVPRLRISPCIAFRYLPECKSSATNGTTAQELWRGVRKVVLGFVLAGMLGVSGFADASESSEMVTVSRGSLERLLSQELTRRVHDMDPQTLSRFMDMLLDPDNPATAIARATSQGASPIAPSPKAERQPAAVDEAARPSSPVASSRGALPFIDDDNDVEQRAGAVAASKAPPMPPGPLDANERLAGRLSKMFDDTTAATPPASTGSSNTVPVPSSEPKLFPFGSRAEASRMPSAPDPGAQEATDTKELLPWEKQDENKTRRAANMARDDSSPVSSPQPRRDALIDPEIDRTAELLGLRLPAEAPSAGGGGPLGAVSVLWQGLSAVFVGAGALLDNLLPEVLRSSSKLPQTEEVQRAILVMKGFIVVSTTAAVVFIARRIKRALADIVAQIPLLNNVAVLLARKPELSESRLSQQAADARWAGLPLNGSSPELPGGDERGIERERERAQPPTEQQQATAPSWGAESLRNLTDPFGRWLDSVFGEWPSAVAQAPESQSRPPPTSTPLPIGSGGNGARKPGDREDSAVRLMPAPDLDIAGTAANAAMAPRLPPQDLPSSVPAARGRTPSDEPAFSAARPPALTDSAARRAAPRNGASTWQSTERECGAPPAGGGATVLWKRKSAQPPRPSIFTQQVAPSNGTQTSRGAEEEQLRGGRGATQGYRRRGEASAGAARWYDRGQQGQPGYQSQAEDEQGAPTVSGRAGLPADASPSSVLWTRGSSNASKRGAGSTRDAFSRGVAGEPSFRVQGQDAQPQARPTIETSPWAQQMSERNAANAGDSSISNVNGNRNVQSCSAEAVSTAPGKEPVRVEAALALGASPVSAAHAVPARIPAATNGADQPVNGRSHPTDLPGEAAAQSAAQISSAGGNAFVATDGSNESTSPAKTVWKRSALVDPWK